MPVRVHCGVFVSLDPDETSTVEPDLEESRLDALYRYALLDTPREESFDDLVKMGAGYFDVPYCLIGLIDRDRVWFKSHFGLNESETSRTEGLCVTAIKTSGIYHLYDASQDEIASTHPLVLPSDGIRFYAGHPLETHDGFKIGSICVMGYEPRDLSDADRDFLSALARLATNEIERRYAQAELQRLNRDLDLRVKARTQALDAVVHDLESEVEAKIRANEAVLLGQERQRRIAELSGDYCFEVDFTDRQHPEIIWFAGPTENANDLVMPEADLSDWEQFVHPEDRALFPALFTTAIEKGEAAAEYRFLRPDARYSRIRIHAGLSRTPAGSKGPNVIVAIKDLDNLRRAEDLVAERTRDLKQSRVQLREARRLAWLGTVAAGLAHQINNPVGSMLAAAQFALLCEEQPEERAQWKKALQDIEKEAKRCGTIVRGIRRFARGEAASKDRENLVEVIASALQLVDSYAQQHRVRLEFDSKQDPIPIRMNKVDIEEMLVNVLRNAIEAGPTRPVRISLNTDGDSATIDILDDGCGVPAEQSQQVFDPFFTTRLEQGGTGLGLSIADGIVADHKGSIEVVSPAESDTRVSIRLPLDLDPELKTESNEQSDRSDAPS